MDPGRFDRNEQRTTNNEQRTTNNEQRTTNNEQRAMSDMETNPFEPPRTTDLAASGYDVTNLIARVFVAFYGVLFTLICVASTIDDIVSGVPVFETLFWLVLSVLTCYGVFALAIRSLRIPKLATFWRYFAYVLPVLSTLGAVWEMYQELPMPTEMLLVVLVVYVIFVAPGLVFNWMLGRRMHRRHARQATAHGHG